MWGRAGTTEGSRTWGGQPGPRPASSAAHPTLQEWNNWQRDRQRRGLKLHVPPTLKDSGVLTSAVRPSGRLSSVHETRELARDGEGGGGQGWRQVGSTPQKRSLSSSWCLTITCGLQRKWLHGGFFCRLLVTWAFFFCTFENDKGRTFIIQWLDDRRRRKKANFWSVVYFCKAQ